MKCSLAMSIGGIRDTEQWLLSVETFFCEIFGPDPVNSRNIYILWASLKIIYVDFFCAEKISYNQETLKPQMGNGCLLFVNHGRLGFTSWVGAQKYWAVFPSKAPLLLLLLLLLARPRDLTDQHCTALHCTANYTALHCTAMPSFFLRSVQDRKW